MTDKLSYTPPRHWWRGYERALDSGRIPQRMARLEPVRKVGAFVFILAVTFMLSGSCLWAAEADSGPARYRVFSLRHISAEKGKEYLAQAKIGTVSQLPGAEMLLVTAQPRELIKAGAILGLVDAKEEFVIRTILAAAGAEDYPSNEQVAAAVGDISIGTFFQPPVGDARTKAIIDIHNGAVVAVAPVSRLEKITSVFERPQKTGKQEPLRPASPAKSIEPGRTNELTGKAIATTELEQPGRITAAGEFAGRADANESGSDELFVRLLSSLDKAEKSTAEQDRQVSGPPIAIKEPNSAAALPEANLPGEPSAGSESREVGTMQPEEVDLTAILESLKADVEEELEPEPGPAIEPVPPRIEQPNEVAEPVSKVGLYDVEPLANGEEILSLDLPPKLTMTEFLGFVGEYLGLNYLYNPAVVKGDVTLMIGGKLRGKVKVKELYKLLEAVMQFYGYVMTRKDNLVTIRPITDAAIGDPLIVHPEGKRVEAGDVVITRIFELKHIDTGSANNLLTGMKLGVQITPIAETGTLIVIGYAYRMARIEQLLEMVDKPGKPKEFKSRQLKYTMAETLAPKIKTLAEQLGTISVAIAAPSVTAPPTRPTRPGRPARRPARPPAARPPAAAAGPTQSTVYLEADKRTNSILMIGHSEQLVVVEELIDALDVKQQDLRSLRLYEIQNVDAEEVRAKLQDLGIISTGTTALRGTAGRPTRPPAKGAKSAPAAPSGTAATEQALVEEPQVVIIETINSLLVNATPEQHAQIAMIIGYVDSEAEVKDIPYVIYPLENQAPEDLAGVLNQLVQETTTKQEKDAKIVTKTQRTEENIIIIPDPKTYSLIVYASKRNQQWISALIHQLDEYRPQVLLDVTLVEVSKTDDFALTLNWLQAFPDLPGSSFDLTKVVMPPGATGSGRDRFIDFDSGGNAFYADKHINFLLNAMQTKNYGRILARPKLLVNDNEIGTIKTSEDKPIVSVETKVIPGTGVVASTAAPSVKIDTYTAGITLEIEPHISKGDQLRLTITLTRIDFRLNKDYSLSAGGEFITGPTPPDLLTSDVTTVVTVPDNHTIILGGLERLNQSKGGTKIPILGDIPIIGGLFRNTANTDSQSRLYVFVKARILRPGEELTGKSDIGIVSAKNRAAFERYEEEMQTYEDWPGIKPQPMDPLRILETD